MSIGIHARKGNVLVTVRRNAVEGTEEQVTRETVRLTRIALGAIVLE